ncbi:hypothetical protein GEMRC1_012349 [Eukaryota sp. GEM-RC1]
MKVFPIPIDTNYCYLLQSSGSSECYVIDPTAGPPVLSRLKELSLRPIGIIALHHHHDHISGIPLLLEHYNIPVYVPQHDIHHFPYPVVGLSDGQIIVFNDITLTVLHTPGHTQGSSCLYATSNDDHVLFTSDNLFHCGCGRLFETADQPETMYNSLQRIKSLPSSTLLYFGHDYAKKNLDFALMIYEDDEVKHRLETLPSSANERSCYPLGRELWINPF